jgi:ferredoxin
MSNRAEPVRPAALLHIDWTACDGRALCTEILPDLLTRDEWGYPLALGYGSNVPVPARMLPAADDAVALCPRLALSLVRPD